VTRPARITITVLSVLLTGAIVLLVWMYVADRAAAAEWALKDAEHIRQRNTALFEANQEHEAAVALLTQAQSAERTKLRGEIEKLRDERNARPTPKTLKECKGQLEKSDQEIALLERNAALDLTSIATLQAALKHETRRGDILEAVVGDEIDRADGWREYARKSKRRDRIKLAFVGIGAGVGGGLVGYGIGATR